MAKRASIPLLICILGAGVAILGLTGIFDGEDGGQPTATQEVAVDTPATPPAADASITIENFAFGSGLSVQPGQTIAVENVDGAPHTLSATNGEFDTGILDGGVGSEFVAPSEAGTYAFFCQLHPSMTGTLTVSS